MIIVSDTTSPTYRLHEDEEKWYLCSLQLDSFKLPLSALGEQESTVKESLHLLFTKIKLASDTALTC